MVATVTAGFGKNIAAALAYATRASDDLLRGATAAGKKQPLQNVRNAGSFLENALAKHATGAPSDAIKAAERGVRQLRSASDVLMNGSARPIGTAPGEGFTRAAMESMHEALRLVS